MIIRIDDNITIEIQILPITEDHIESFHQCLRPGGLCLVDNKWWNVENREDRPLVRIFGKYNIDGAEYVLFDVPEYIGRKQIMWEYAGLIRSESLLDQGLRNLKRLKEKVSRSIKARNGHELGRCFEVMNLLDVGEVVMLAAGKRKETRGAQRRTEYPFTNPMMDKALVIRKEGEKPVFGWMEKGE